MAELLIVIALISLIVALVSATFLTSTRSSRSVIDITRSEIDARVAVYKLSKDIRETTNILLADNDQIKITSNVDADEEYEQVYYFLNTGSNGYNLMRQIDSNQAKVVISNVISNNIFSYFTSIGTPSTGIAVPVSEVNLNRIKIIGINVSVDQSGNNSGMTTVLDTMISLRNKF